MAYVSCVRLEGVDKVGVRGGLEGGARGGTGHGVWVCGAGVRGAGLCGTYVCGVVCGVCGIQTFQSLT